MNVFGLGIELDAAGSHPAAWRRADHAPSESLSKCTTSTLRGHLGLREPLTRRHFRDDAASEAG